MASFIDPLLDAIDSVLEWVGTSLKQTASSYVELEAADREHTLVSRDGSLISFIRIEGIRFLVGSEEFERIHGGISRALQTAMGHNGHTVQMVFSYDKDAVKGEIADIFVPARNTAKRLELGLDDLFDERINYLANYCAKEQTFLVLWTTPALLSRKQREDALKRKRALVKKHKIPPMRNAQSIVAALGELRESHESFVRATVSDFNLLGFDVDLLTAHQAIYHARNSVDPEFTDKEWQPYLVGDKIPRRAMMPAKGRDVSDIMWPNLARQIVPRDGENLGLHTAQIGDRIYAPLFIDLFPKEIQHFGDLFQRCFSANIPWRISFLMEGNGLYSISFKSAISAILSFASSDNALINDAAKYLKYIETNTDDSVIKLRVALTTWAPVGQMSVLRTRAAELAKAVQGWGHCEVSDVSGDAFEAVLSTTVGLMSRSIATPSVAPLTDAVYMLPITRPSSAWEQGAILFRSPDGKPWPYQPGSTKQTTWIDLIYARPGSGKSVLSNAINLALCLNGGLQRLPRIAIIDIGPSSSGLISLIKEALPPAKRHLAAYHRLRMTPDYAINPFDTQLGCRYPTPIERSFLVNFLTLLATPLGSDKPYDGITDMAGMVVDELYKSLADDGNPHAYSIDREARIDAALREINFNPDTHATWWEITDALFAEHRIHEAYLAQRYAMPLVVDATSICRAPAIEDLFGRITAPTGEPLVQAFGRMISSAVREYPILSRVSAFDLGEARVVSLDLDEVAKTGGEAADRQTAVMYMIARYIMARDYYLTLENLQEMSPNYHAYHKERITEIREDPKRIVFDEFHRTSKARAVRDQVIVDMREGRKWKVQVALLSQALEDFDPVMVDFATSIFIMDAGPAQSVEKSAKVFGLSDTARHALRTRVHGPRAGGGTFLAQFATKQGINVQLLTNTIGPIELWAFSTTAEDARVRNELYERIGPKNARYVLAGMYPSGSIAHVIESRLASLKETGLLDDNTSKSVFSELVEEIIVEYKTNPVYREK